jgi:hypothetical protein
MITTHHPTDWRDLQRQVGRILEECGFDVEVERVLDTVRGRVEIDVFGIEEVKGRPYTVLCECKNWTRNVSQDAIHAFRTVVHDVGANVGYVISSAGFQSGAHRAADHTNLQLMTWTEFQQVFEPAWIENFLLRTVVDRIDPLFSFIEPILPRWFSELGEKAQAEYMRLHNHYNAFGWLMMLFTPYHAAIGPIPSLPLREHASPSVLAAGTVPAEVLDAVAYREFLEVALPYGEAAIAEFRELRPTD